MSRSRSMKRSSSNMERYHGVSDANLNISDIIEVIQTQDPGCMATITMNTDQPHVQILEQPASKAMRFRYECEGRSAGSIPGVNSTPESKTFPSIRIVGYKGRAMVVVSCVTKDFPHKPHPHNLVGKEACKQGVCTVEVPTESMTVTFSNLGIQCVKKKDIGEALKIREQLRVDPFRTGFEHKKQPTSIDLNAVRLCFQVFVEGSHKGKFNRPLPPVVSDPIFDKKAMSDLVICKLSHCTASVAGGLEMILLCEKVAKEDIQVRFFEEKDGQLIWEGFADFSPTHVHKQTAITFRTPSYRTHQIEQLINVSIQLRRPSDGATSEALPFQLYPLGTDEPDSLRRKRQKLNNSFISRTNVEKPAAKQHATVNIIKSEPSGTMLPFGPTSIETYSLQPVGFPESNSDILRPEVSSESASPLQYDTYSLIEPCKPQQSQPNTSIMQPTSTNMYMHQFSFQSQIQPQPLVLQAVTSNSKEERLQPLTAETAAVPDTSFLDIDNQHCTFDWNPLDSAELAAFGVPLSANLSSGLSLSEVIKDI